MKTIRYDYLISLIVRRARWHLANDRHEAATAFQSLRRELLDAHGEVETGETDIVEAATASYRRQFGEDDSDDLLSWLNSLGYAPDLPESKTSNKSNKE